MPLTIAVAMCTYNGSKYVKEQLESIVSQSRKPDSMVICDDRSTDDTLEILQSFAKSECFPVIVEENANTLGVAHNFEKAIGLCNADIIALADQDDIWNPDKLAVIEKAFNDDNDLSLVFSNAALLDENLKPLNLNLSDTSKIDANVESIIKSPQSFDYLIRRNVATGATIAFRSSYKDLILPLPETLATYHDAWIIQLISAVGKIGYIPENLISYRQHTGQQTWDFVHSSRKILTTDHYRQQYAQVSAMRDRLIQYNETGTERQVELLNDFAIHLENRSHLASSLYKRLPIIFAELTSGRYNRFSSGWKSAIRDLIMGS